MKNSIIFFSGLLILGVCMIISSIILSNSLTNHHYTVDGVRVSQSVDANKPENEYMAIGDVARLLGYHNIDIFTQDVIENKFGDLPYVYINGELIFSRTAFNEWLVDSARSKRDKK